MRCRDLHFTWARFRSGKAGCPGFCVTMRGSPFDSTMLALIAGGVTLELFAAALAPLGYQDDRGFHLGAEQHQIAEDL